MLSFTAFLSHCLRTVIENSLTRAAALDLAGIHSFPKARNRLKVQIVVVDLKNHERSIGIETFCGVGGRSQVMRAQLSAAARNKVVDPIMRLHPFVDMLVAGQDYTHSVSLKNWLQL